MCMLYVPLEALNDLWHSESHPAADEDDRLLPRCLHTTMRPAGMLASKTGFPFTTSAPASVRECGSSSDDSLSFSSLRNSWRCRASLEKLNFSW
ncbi:hypothetical protein SAY87_029426 [Trapa incisa]|uniref:Uncharacterized protein n=1 Tax=Trapa incisa TaxID=236973 RepID=A0AAN7KCU9_9MYRT|nr:hypothetical protein SAY87_029426 [Trapa incisa]